MQNLVRLPEILPNVEELHDQNTWWANELLAQNIRQCFMAEDPNGQLIVGDFKAVESRGLAYLSGEDWKLDAYRQGRDIYKMLATTYQSFKGTAYEDVTKQQRQAGKVGELACGYGAGPKAVQGFAEKMGIDMSETEAGAIVRDWRGANPKIVSFWGILDSMLRLVMSEHTVEHDLPYGGCVRLRQIQTPDSLLKQHPGAQSIQLRVMDPNRRLFLTRVFHGCYWRGNDICYYKPSELKGGDLWRARMTNPPHAWYKLYGGKLAGILTQSFCRELFFGAMYAAEGRFHDVDNVQLIGQFHDEMVVEWTPPDGRNNQWDLMTTIDALSEVMSNPGVWTSFPLEADVKYGHRYIK